MDLMLWKAYLPRILVWDHRLDVELLVSSLKKLIDLYPYLAGRICYTSTAHPFVIGNNKGVKFVCESFDEPLPFPNDRSPINTLSYPELNNLVINVPPEAINDDTPLFIVKLSLYRNGSVLGTTISHGLVDGHSRYNVMRAWADIARDLSSHMPDFRRLNLREKAYNEATKITSSFKQYSGDPFSNSKQFRHKCAVLRMSLAARSG